MSAGLIAHEQRNSVAIVTFNNPPRDYLNQTPVGQAAGIAYLSLLVSNTDMNEAAEAVFAAGGIIESFLPNGFSFWDPDGIRVLVRSTDML